MPLWLAGEPLVLASKSAIRHALLRDAGVAVEVQPADIDERTIEQRSAARDAGELAALLAREKARTIAARLPGRLVLGADQTLALGERRFSQPRDRAGARAQLLALRGPTHELHTPVGLMRESTVWVEHRLVQRLEEGQAAAAIEAAFPGTTGGGKVDRDKLAARVLGDSAALKRLEAIVHPLVQEAERRLLAEAEARGEKVAVLDIPLLFETGGEKRGDAGVVVSAPPEVQRSRWLERPGMTVEKREAITSKQMAH